jgi:hypothetical protein
MKKLIIVIAIIFVSCQKETIDPIYKREGSSGRPADTYIYHDSTNVPRK